MRILHLLAVAPLLAGASSLWHHAPPRGPGVVVDAVCALQKAIDAGDRAALERAFASMDAREGFACSIDPDTGKRTAVPTAGGIVFQDVAADGTILRAGDAAGAIAALLERVNGEDRQLATRVTTVRADCPGPGCSWASIEFERSFQRDGKAVRVPMHATALARFVEAEPHLRIFLWHASPAPK